MLNVKTWLKCMSCLKKTKLAVIKKFSSTKKAREGAWPQSSRAKQQVCCLAAHANSWADKKARQQQQKLAFLFHNSSLSSSGFFCTLPSNIIWHGWVKTFPAKSFWKWGFFCLAPPFNPYFFVFPSFFYPRHHSMFNFLWRRSLDWGSRDDPVIKMARCFVSEWPETIILGGNKRQLKSNNPTVNNEKTET